MMKFMLFLIIPKNLKILFLKKRKENILIISRRIYLQKKLYKQ
jgi:hypothetical protein